MSKRQPSRVNTVILSSIPMNRKVKRYWISKYERIATNCGTEEACKKFKQLRVVLLNYKSDPDRKSNLDRYLSQTGFRTNGMLRALFETCDCQPQFVLNFLKIYSAPTKDRKDLETTGRETQRRLESVKANPAVPKYLSAWLSLLWKRPSESYKIAASENHPLHRAQTLHTYEEWKAYWLRWRNILMKGWKSGQHLDYKQVFPEVYKDYKSLTQSSDSFEKDFAQLVAMHVPEERMFVGMGALSDQSIHFIDEFLADDVASELQKIINSEDDGVVRHWMSYRPFMGIGVGEVQHLPKKGGGTDYRDIAVPNRFIQSALEPIANRLYHLLRCLPKDATFDQSRFDTVLVNRVTNDSLYQGSVDLSKATDNLPRNWGIAIVMSIMSHCYLTPEERLLRQIFGDECPSQELERRERASWTLFQEVSSANWVDADRYVDQWMVGQPLGSLPSFALLGITHNLYVEAMGCSLGLLHSPYVVLGDDLVVFNHRLRKKYIKEAISRSIPLSLSKSYSGDLSEFAGKLFIKSCVPFHCTDHGPLTWQSLMDYQRATGIWIPWSSLPRQLKRHYRKVVKAECKKIGLSAKQSANLVDSSYRLLQLMLAPPLGSSPYPAIPDNWVKYGVLEKFSEVTHVTKDERDRRSRQTSPATPSSGVVMLRRSPVQLLSERYANKDGWFLRFRPVELPSWYKTKFRPCSTDDAILASIEALRTTV